MHTTENFKSIWELFIIPKAKKYVDDTIVVLKRTRVAAFHDHLNQQNCHIKFTIERDKGSGIPFLDTLNVVKSDGSITTSVYRKPTHSDRYLNFLSHHPIQHKTSVVETLYTRAFLVNSDETNLKQEEQHITHSLKSNGYSI